MAWLRIDDRVRTHPKVVKAGPAAAWLWFCGICYCREHLTDGFLSFEILPSLAPGVVGQAPRKYAEKLVVARLWHEVEGGYQVHDFLEWNPTRADVLAKRAADAARKKGGAVGVDSTRNSSGLPTDSTATRDAHAGAPPGSGLGYGSGLDGSPEGGPGETAPRRGGSLITSPLAWDRRHGSHVTGLCDWVCLPGELADEFAGRLPGDREQNRLQVEDWARSVKADWQARGQVPAERMYDFWNFRWQEQFPSSKPAATRGGSTLRGMAAAVKVDD